MAFDNELDQTIGVGENNPFANQFGGLEESEQFPSSKILSFDRSGAIERYAILRNDSGELRGSSFTIQELKVYGENESTWVNSGASARALESKDKMMVGGKEVSKFRVGPVYQLHQEELAQIERYLKEKGMTI